MTQTTKLNEYDLQATNFMQATKTAITSSFKEYAPYFPDDKESRDIFKITLSTPKGRYTFTFGQSQNNSTGNGDNPPSAYDIFTCLEKYDPESFEYFCSNYGYDTDSRKAEKIYKAVCKEYKALCRLYTTEELEQMAEIQ